MRRVAMFDLERGFYDERVDAHDVGGLEAIERYGDWTRNNEDGRFFVCGQLGSSDFSPGAVAAEANTRAWKKEFARGEGKWWKEIYGGHGTCAIIIDLKKVPPKRQKDVSEFLGAVESEVVVDDTELAEVENEKQDEAWSNWVGADFARGIERKWGFEFDKIDDDKLRELFEMRAPEANQYWTEESGGDMWIDPKKVAEKVTEADVERLHATFLTND
jgi:hypothetical protein